MSSDRIFGLVMAGVAFAYIASATQIQVSFLSDPVGPKGFPILIGSVWAISGLTMAVKPDPEPSWPGMRTLGTIALAVVVLIGYAYALKPLGFLLPTAIAAGVLSYLITPGLKRATISGIAISVTLFLIFRYALGLGLFAFPRGLLS